MAIRGRKIIIAGAALIVYSLTVAATTGVTVNAAIDRETVAIGDNFRYTVTVVAPSQYTVSLAEPGEAFTGFAVRDFGSDRRSRPFSKQTQWTWWYELDTYTTGEYRIGGVAVTWAEDGQEQTVTTEPVTVTVKSLLTAERMEDLRDIRGPVAAQNRLGFLLSGILIIAVALALAWRFFPRRTGAPAEAAVPVWRIALDRLRDLRQTDLPGQGRIKEYYSELSDIVRHYIEGRFDIHAAEMTTEEFLAHVREHRLLIDDHTRLLKEFLVAADMVKFAQYGPGPDEVEHSYAAAERFVNETADRPVEPAVGTDDL